VGAGGGFSWTTISFGGRDLDLNETSVSVALAWHGAGRWGGELGLGAVVDGSIGDVGLGAGFLASVGASFLALPEGQTAPFVLVTGSLAASTTSTSSGQLTALDLRAGVLVGKTFFGHVTPYLAGRVFGGPVFYQGDTGTDTHHYAVGGGLTIRAGGFDLFAEGIPLGERALSFGIGWRFGGRPAPAAPAPPYVALKD
jgi:hypothetical protein